MEYGTIGEKGDALLKDMTLKLTPTNDLLLPSDNSYVLY